MKKFFLVLVVLLMASTAAGDTIVEHYSTLRGDELIARLPLTKRFYTAYILRIPDLAVGDVVSVAAQFEATNDLGFNVMLGHTLMVHDYEAIAYGATAMPEGAYIAPCFPATENITANMHHGRRILAGAFTASYAGDHWVSVVVYSGSSAASSGDYLTFHERYGGLSAVVHRNDATWAPEPLSGTFTGTLNADGTISGDYRLY